ncbi:MAG: DUF1501 domain-containing protein [Planctomycetaceae bacterium]|nr:DUF1501 domain-containing protein [Planctomycetaceae bacterium]
MTSHFVDTVQVRGRGFSRRRFVQSVATAAAASGALSFRQLMATQADALRRQHRALILLWMQGGPSQFETFDPKPGTENGGPTEAIATSVPGIRIADNFPRVAEQMEHIALVRSMNNKEGSHPRATYQMHTGYVPSGSLKHPTLASCVAQQIAPPDGELPSFVSVGSTEGAGFLGMDFEPFIVNSPGRMPSNVGLPVSKSRFASRTGLLNQLDNEFARSGPAGLVETHRSLYGKTSRLVLSPETSAFDIAEEPAALQDRYGNSDFGRGCLLARRLVERGVTCVEVRSGNWDTHQDNFDRCAENAGQVDPAMAALITDLKDRGLLDSTLIVWMGEFGRTPKINARTGRDHYPRVFNLAMAGGGIVGGKVHGASTADGTAIQDDPVSVQDLFRTMCGALRVNADHENMSPIGRPMKIVDGGTPIPGFLS